MVGQTAFGTGYSSLSDLRSFPFDKIKIDQSLAHKLVGNKQSISIMGTAAALGRSLYMKTTAEVVETLEQLAMPRQEGCTEVQGWLHSQRKPASESSLG